MTIFLREYLKFHCLLASGFARIHLSRVRFAAILGSNNELATYECNLDSGEEDGRQFLAVVPLPTMDIGQARD